ncbi:hypothetical protein PI125_g23003 [Phytophthora idaei]|nr:hypothetical protein PI125_g23003 [Phytophthora idaei]
MESKFNAWQLDLPPTSYGVSNNQYASHRTSTSLMWVAQVKEDEKIEVSCWGTSYVADTASYLKTIRVGS